MAHQSFELRERFHLTLLRHLAARLSGRSYAVKGGIALRFFHRSSRLSEDVDFDVASNVRAETLRKAVDSVLEGPALAASLTPYGIESLSTTRPKQTETTQRWKTSLRLVGGASLPTKVEFSRRRDELRPATGVPDAELLRRYGMAPFAARFYDAKSLAVQKIAALASPARNALRDLFDLHHLFFTIGVEPADAAERLDDAVIEAAAEKVGVFALRDFKEQVVPYLSGELIDLYRDPVVFEGQKQDVERALIGMLK